MATYDQLFSQAPGAIDPEQFYTPELQQAILDALQTQIGESQQQAQASISGQAIKSGFGVGGSSREGARRARADANALDQIVQGYVSQAAQLETMKRQAEQDKSSNDFNLEETRKNNEQAFKLAREGYQNSLANYDLSQRDARRAATQESLFSGISGIASALPYLYRRPKTTDAVTGAQGGASAGILPY